MVGTAILGRSARTGGSTDDWVERNAWEVYGGRTPGKAKPIF